MRLDQRLVAAALARSRGHARELIKAGHVQVNGQVVYKAALQVGEADRLSAATDPWVSRAAHKLLGALDESGLQVGGRVLDAGAATGGFTQVLLSRGASQVYAVDVGHDQLAQVIRDDRRVVVRERLNLRDLRLTHVDGRPVDLLVADVSFISLTLLLKPMLGVVAAGGDALLMIKPQFEVGRTKLGPGGVVRSAADRAAAIDAVLAAAEALGWLPRWQADSQLAGPAGNLEHFVWLVHQ